MDVEPEGPGDSGSTVVCLVVSNVNEADVVDAPPGVLPFCPVVSGEGATENTSGCPLPLPLPLLLAREGSERGLGVLLLEMEGVVRGLLRRGPSESSGGSAWEARRRLPKGEFLRLDIMRRRRSRCLDSVSGLILLGCSSSIVC